MKYTYSLYEKDAFVGCITLVAPNREYANSMVSRVAKAVEADSWAFDFYSAK